MKRISKLSLALASAGLTLAIAGEAKALTLEFDSQIGSPGFGPGELFVPQGIGVGPEDGNVYVANGRGQNPDGSFNPDLGNRVDVFSPDGEYLRAITSGSQEPGAGLDGTADIKFDPFTGNLYIGDVFNSEVDVYEPNTGEFVTSFGSFSGAGPNDIFFGPGGMDFDAQGNLYVTDFSGDVVKVYGRDGELINSFGELGDEPKQFDGPAGLIISENTGNIYINDQFNNRVQVLDSEENFLFAFGTEGTEPGQFNEPIGIEVDEFENIYVADSQNNRVQVFDSEGNFLTQFGEPVADPGPPAPGEPPFATNPADLEPGVFNWTGGLNYVDDELYVGDFFSGRVQVLSVEDNEPAQQQSVPEPSSVFSLTLLGLGGLSAAWRRRRQHKAIG